MRGKSITVGPNKNARKFNLGFIGCGKMARCHAEVVEDLGHRIEAVVARPGSAHIDNFAKTFGVSKKFYSLPGFIEELRRSGGQYDALVIATAWEAQEKILRQLLPYFKKPIFVEKPAVLSMSSLKKVKALGGTKNVLVAYNRRHYDFMPSLKAMIAREGLLCVDILAADPYTMLLKQFGGRLKDHVLHYYTAHIIDTMFYLLGDVTIKEAKVVKHQGKKSWVCQLMAKKTPVQLKILMDSPQNSYMKFFFKNKVVQLCPLEKMVVYDRIERVEHNGRGIYQPGEQSQVVTSDKFKPGLWNQMSYFLDHFVARKNSSSTHFKQIEDVTAFCDTLVKMRP